MGAELASLGGERFAARSWQGRDVPAAHFPGSGPGLVVTAGQHADETSGVVGALRAARALAGRGVRFATVPLENPDGYALHRRLCRVHPGHMHHAARYMALGDDLQAREAEPRFEAHARREALRRANAVLHVSLHGYPAGEWTRPFTGYVPRGFEAWSIPRGFFLIPSHRPGLATRGRGSCTRWRNAWARSPNRERSTRRTWPRTASTRRSRRASASCGTVSRA